MERLLVIQVKRWRSATRNIYCPIMRWLLALLIALFASHPAAACSVEEGYKVPTNFELVQKAKVIVLARVKNAPSGLDEMSFDKPQVTLEPIRFLKGQAPAEHLLLLGWQVPADMSGGLRGVPTVTTLSQSHWSSGIGGCIRQFYEPGEFVVAFFEENAKAREVTGLDLFEIFEPFARVVETVDGPNDLWVRAVERYVGLLDGPPEKLNDRIKTAVAELQAIDAPEAKAMAADLEYHLERQDRAGTWSALASPLSANAGAYKQPGAILYCVAGAPPGIMFEGRAPLKAELLIDGRSFIAERAPPGAAEKTLLDPPTGKGDKSRSLYRFADVSALLAASRIGSTNAEIRADGKPVASGEPLDALLRFASHCEKLQRMPAPTEEDLRPKRAARR